MAALLYQMTNIMLNNKTRQTLTENVRQRKTQKKKRGRPKKMIIDE